MTGQLVYTSAPRGLDSGTSGFCTVARSRNLPPKLARTLEQISGYRSLASGERPVAYSCVYVDDASRRVVSRVADAGLDHTGRSNKIAHHIVLSNNDLNATEPAAIFTDRRLFRERWDGEPAYLDETLVPASIFPNFCRCDAWKAVLDDPGWGGYIASTVFSLRPVVLVVSPGVDVLRLFLEAIAVLPPQKRWDATFSTYFMREFPGCRCQWKAVYAGTPEAENATRRVPQNALVVDLTRSVPPLDTLSLTREEENFIALAREAAKTGVLPGASAARSSVSTPTAPFADVYAPTSPNVAVPRVAPSVNPDGLRERRSSKYDYTIETPRRVDSIPLKRKSRITFVFFVVWLLATLVVSGLALVAGLKYGESQRAPSPDDVRQEPRDQISSTQTSSSSDPGATVETASEAGGTSSSNDKTNEADGTDETLKDATKKVTDVLTASVKAATNDDKKSVDAVTPFVKAVVKAATADEAANDEEAKKLVEAIANAAEKLVEAIAENVAEESGQTGENVAEESNQVAKAAEDLGKAVVNAARIVKGENAKVDDAAKKLLEALKDDLKKTASEVNGTSSSNDETASGADANGKKPVSEAGANDETATETGANGKKPVSEAGANDETATETGATDKESKSEADATKEGSSTETGATDKESKSEADTTKEGSSTETGATDKESKSEADATKEGSSNPESQSGAGATEQPQAAENPEGGTASPQSESDSGDVATAENNVSEDDLNDAFTTFKKKFDNEKIDGVYVVASATLDPATPANEFDAFATGEIADSFGKMFKAWYDSAKKLDFGAEIQLLVVNDKGLKFDDSTEEKTKKKTLFFSEKEKSSVYQLDFPLTFTIQRRKYKFTFRIEVAANPVDANSPPKPRFAIVDPAPVDPELVLRAMGVGARIRYYYNRNFTDWSTLFKPSSQNFGKTYKVVEQLYGSSPKLPVANDSKLALELSPFCNDQYAVTRDEDFHYMFWQGFPASDNTTGDANDADLDMFLQGLPASDNAEATTESSSPSTKPNNASKKTFALYYLEASGKAQNASDKVSNLYKGYNALRKYYYSSQNVKMPTHQTLAPNIKQTTIYVPIVSLSLAKKELDNNKKLPLRRNNLPNGEYKDIEVYTDASTDDKKIEKITFKVPEITLPTKWTLYLAFPSPKQDNQDNQEADAKRIRIPLATGDFGENASKK